MGRNHGGKRRKCWFPAFSPLPTMFSKGLFLWVIKSRDCLVKSLNFAQSLPQFGSNNERCSQLVFESVKKKTLSGKGKTEQFVPFPTML